MDVVLPPRGLRWDIRVPPHGECASLPGRPLSQSLNDFFSATEVAVDANEEIACAVRGQRAVLEACNHLAREVTSAFGSRNTRPLLR
jgi:hypothetical protein